MQGYSFFGLRSWNSNTLDIIVATSLGWLSKFGLPVKHSMKLVMSDLYLFGLSYENILYCWEFLRFVS